MSSVEISSMSLLLSQQYLPWQVLRHPSISSPELLWASDSSDSRIRILWFCRSGRFGRGFSFDFGLGLTRTCGFGTNIGSSSADPLSLSLFCGWQLGNVKDDLLFSGYTTQLGVVSH